MLSLRKMREADLQNVLAWRNRQDVRAGMFTSHEISWSEHTSWFNRVNNDTSKRILIVEINGEPSGVVNFTNVDTKAQTAFWGFYSRNPAERGIGSVLGFLGIDYALENLGLRKIKADVLESNKRSVAFHRKMGFQLEGVLREEHFDGERAFDVLRFAILRRDWNAFQKPHFYKVLTEKFGDYRYEL